VDPPHGDNHARELSPGNFVYLAFTQIRFYTADNIQIARRLRAMIFNLKKTLPSQRPPGLGEEL
jgi:hypothetical protein